MTQRIDLYTLLRHYADKTNSPYIDIDSFISFLEIQAARQVKEYPEWVKWTGDTNAKFHVEISSLLESGKCEILPNTAAGQIFLPYYYIELIQQAYLAPDESAEQPFPSEDSLKIHFADDAIRVVRLDQDFVPYLEETGESPEPSSVIIRLVFPEKFGSALVLSSMLPRRILEMALLKIRSYLRNHGNQNKDYVLHKLIPRLQGREGYLRDMLSELSIRPLECLAKLEEGGENSSFFWVCFCSLIRNDIKKKSECLQEDLALIQSVYLLDICNSFYQVRAIKHRERELALKNLDLQLDAPPFLYSLEAITKFANSKGIPLMGQYSPDDLDAYIKTKTTPAVGQQMPELLIISGKDFERWFVKRSKLILLCMRLLNDARPRIKIALEKRWGKLIREYRKEAAMANDEDFEKLLKACIEKITPTLAAVLKSSWLYLVYEEFSRHQTGMSEMSKLYIDGKLAPYAALLLLNRKNIQVDIRMLLPFWYAIPILVAIISFFKRLQKRPESVKQLRESQNSIDVEPEEYEEPSPQDRDPVRELRRAARELEKNLVPAEHTIDTYLRELEDGWGRLLKKQARENLAEDVNALIRDRLRQTLRMKKRIVLTQDTLNDIALGIISSTPSLKDLSGQESLRLYIVTYLIKQLMNEPLPKAL
jgi:hypothetical protein